MWDNWTDSTVIWLIAFAIIAMLLLVVVGMVFGVEVVKL